MYTMATSTKKNVLIVYAHPERRSFNGAILDAAIETLKCGGHTVELSDLYDMGFNAVLSGNDVKGDMIQPDKLDWSMEMAVAYTEGRIADDILKEQIKLDAADLVIFQFPLYWMGFPAIMKGWWDRVMHHGYAVDIPPRTFDLARFKGKKAMLSFTTGGSRAAYSDRGIMGDIDINLWPLQNGALRFVGYDVLAPHIVYGLDSTEKATEVLKEWRHRLQSLFNEPPLQFFRRTDFDSEELLKEDIVIRFNDNMYGPTVGQHCNKAIPSGSQSTIPQS